MKTLRCPNPDCVTSTVIRHGFYKTKSGRRKKIQAITDRIRPPSGPGRRVLIGVDLLMTGISLVTVAFTVRRLKMLAKNDVGN